MPAHEPFPFCNIRAQPLIHLNIFLERARRQAIVKPVVLAKEGKKSSVRICMAMKKDDIRTQMRLRENSIPH
jgi:hypothetical protein